jgi:CheY-like chemotaxis protein
MRYRIALCGFSAFEYRAMHFSFQHPPEGETGYDVVDALVDADFAVVDADSSPAVKGVVLTGRVPKAVFVGLVAPPGAGAHVPRPIDTTRILRALAEVSERHAAPPPRAPVPITLVEVELDPAATFESFAAPAAIAPPPLLSDPFAPTPAPPPSAAEPPESAEPPEPAEPPERREAPVDEEADARRVAKNAARAAARRARLAHINTDPGQLEGLRDVMVLDADEAASDQLTELLELFGFRVHAVRTIAHAAGVLARHQLVAAFLDITLDGDGVALLQAIQDLPRLVGHSPPEVLLVAAQLDPADRVRAALAGIRAPLVKPVSRGDVARALEACDVVLPADARRSR